MGVRKTSVVIDEELLATAREVLGTDTIRETVDAALREVLRQRARQREVDALTEMRGMDLADDEVMAHAWRS